MTESRFSPGRQWLRTLGGAVALLTILRVWLGPVDIVPAAQAQIPDSGLQRKQILDQSRRTNELLARILNTLETRTFNVRIEGADKKSTAPARRRSG